MNANLKSKSPYFIITLVAVIVVGIGLFSLYRRWKPKAPSALSIVYTIAGAPIGGNEVRFKDPFGIALDKNDYVYVTDGETGKLWQIKPNGSARVVIDNLNTPSGVAVAPDGSLVIAETGAQVITRVFPADGHAQIIAGAFGVAGFLDGARKEALFNGPIGVAVAQDGTIYVADTYNDRVRAIDGNGNVRTIAGGAGAGFADAQEGTDARFDTPCGIAISPDGALIVADTGNHRIRRVESNGSVRTITGTGEDASEDGLLIAAKFSEPIGIAVDKDGTIYVADFSGSVLMGCGWNIFPRVWTLAGGTGTGFQDGEIESARLNHPTGLALAADGTILFADNGNRVVRGIGGKSHSRGTTLDSNALSSLWPSLSEFRASAAPRWPFDPPERPREIAATFGEIRGELTDANKQVWFHNGLDIPGAYGETVHAVRAERVLDPISVKDVGTTRERIRFPTLGYIHVRIGRDANERVLDESKFLAQHNLDGRVSELRVRRGTWFSAGDAIGTLNNQNHVHLIAGTSGKEFNAIAALDLPGIKDTVAPTIEEDGVKLYDFSWHELAGVAKNSRININGDVRIVVRAYDQMDGNAARRRLGLYRLGYQVFGSDGTTPSPGFAEPHMTLLFETLPRDENSAQLVYASGSRSGATGETIFAYIVTSTMQGGEARDTMFTTSSLSNGDYTVRVFAGDFFGNRATRDTLVHISSSPN